MGILNYSTGISSEKTISEIQMILVKHGAHKIVTDYKDGLPISVTFCLTINDNLTGFSLPANYSGVLKAMKADKKVENRYCNPEQAQRVAWRIAEKTGITITCISNNLSGLSKRTNLGTWNYWQPN